MGTKEKTNFASIDNRITEIRKGFPILQAEANGKPLIYLDNAATTQKPSTVISSIEEYYRKYNSNVHRGIHYLSDLATRAMEQSRETIQNFLNAQYSHEIIFTKGTTDSINLVAHSLGKMLLSPGDEILISEMEHHANIVPWQMACETYQAKLKVIPVDPQGNLVIDTLSELITARTKIIALVHTSNTLGTINPVKDIIDIAHQQNIPVLLDGAQAIPHKEVDVQALDVDFYTFSGHKTFGPTGIGVLYGKEKWLEKMPPYQGGGAMINEVTFAKTTYQEPPFKFEAGTPNIAGIIGLKTAIDYLNKIGYNLIEQQEANLLDYTTKRLSKIPEIKIIGTAAKKASVISFVHTSNHIHPSDIGTILDQYGIAVRTGHHCTQPLLRRYNLPATVRASFAFYNTIEEVDHFIAALNKALKMFK